MNQYNIHQAKARLSELVQKAMLGEEIIIAKDNKPVVKISALNLTKRKIGSARGMVKISKDFNDPLKDFEDYSQ